MSITLTLTTAEEARLRQEAEQNGMAPAELATQRLRQHWTGETSQKDEIAAKLHRWREETKTEIQPHISSNDLHAMWAQEEAQMTQEERDAEDRLWEDIQKSIDESRGASRAEWVRE